MSRLDSLIRRLHAQRACLEHAAALIGALPGPILELGFGHGRTCDHLRQLCPDRPIVVFERNLAGAAGIVPSGVRIVLGDLRRTLPAARGGLGARAALIHSDVGTGDPARNAGLAAFLAAQLPGLLRPGGIILSDQDLAGCRAVPLPAPPEVPSGRYFLYRRAASSAEVDDDRHVIGRLHPGPGLGHHAGRTQGRREA